MGILRRAASNFVWVGKATLFLLGLAVTLAVVLGVATAAMGKADKNSSRVFLLGQTNTAQAMSALVGSVAADAMLLIDNDGGGPALELHVNQDQPPMKVDSQAKVNNLNADSVDGKGASEFVTGGGQLIHGRDVLVNESAQLVNIPGFGRIEAKDEADLPGRHSCSITFVNESGGTLYGLVGESITSGITIIPGARIVLASNFTSVEGGQASPAQFLISAESARTLSGRAGTMHRTESDPESGCVASVQGIYHN